MKAEPPHEPVVRLIGLGKTFPKAPSGTPPALDDLTADIPAGCMVGIMGPDAAGKTTLMRLLAGLLLPTAGEVLVMGRPPDSSGKQDGLSGRRDVGYMPQRFGLYEDLSVIDNLTLHADLCGLQGAARTAMFTRLLRFTGLTPFTRRLAGRLSGGMKQKLGLACALLTTPRLLLLDEPGVGVDPLSRRELWSMVSGLAGEGMSVLWATAYMDEAARCAHVLMLEQGRIVYQGPPAAFTERLRGRVFQLGPPPGQARQVLTAWTSRQEVRDALIQGSRVRIVLDAKAAGAVRAGTADGWLGEHGKALTAVEPQLEDAYIDAVGGLDHTPSAFSVTEDGEAAYSVALGETGDEPVIRARGLTKRFGEFVAARDITFDVRPGEIFGLLGPNGAGKSTTFRMLCGLSTPTGGTCFVAGANLLTAPGPARSKLGYMAQKFSLYGELTVLQNLRLMADYYGIPLSLAGKRIRQRIQALDLESFRHVKAVMLPLGQKQRLSMACATLHNPPVLFLDEPTSGVDPRTRREFWKHINAMTANGVAVLVTTHFMEEAEYCDRIALINHGRIIAQGTPDSLRAEAPVPAAADPSFEDAFIAYVEHSDDAAEAGEESAPDPDAALPAPPPAQRATLPAVNWLRKLRALIVKEFKQIVRDVSSYIVAVVLPLIFLLLFGYGITLDAGVMKIAVLNESGSAEALNLAINFSHSAHFKVVEARSRAEAGRMMSDSVLDAFIVIPTDFKARLEEGEAPIQVVVSGAEPNTANFIRAYSQGVIGNWQVTRNGEFVEPPIVTEPRYWFNPAATSHWYLVPGSITMVMTLIGAMLTALVIAREWERGTLEALYATPVTRMQILLGKLIPYYVLGLFSMSLCALAGVFLFGLPFHGSVGALFMLSTGFLLPTLGQGLFISVATREQLLAAQASLLTAFLPALMLSGFIFDINSMPTVLQWLTVVVPARYFNVSLQTVFLAGDLWSVFIPGMLYMLGLAAIFFTATYARLVKRLDA